MSDSTIRACTDRQILAGDGRTDYSECTYKHLQIRRIDSFSDDGLTDYSENRRRILQRMDGDITVNKRTESLEKRKDRETTAEVWKMITVNGRTNYKGTDGQFYSMVN